MKDGHFHTNVETLLIGAAATLVIFNGIRLLAAPLAVRDDWLGTAGRAVGALVHF